MLVKAGRESGEGADRQILVKQRNFPVSATKGCESLSSVKLCCARPTHPSPAWYTMHTAVRGTWFQDIHACLNTLICGGRFKNQL